MKRAILYLSSIMILLFITTGCTSSDGSGDSTKPQTTETSFNFTLTSFKKQETASSALGRLASFTADQVMTGQLTATNTETSEIQTFDWSIYFDEETWEVQSNKTIILAPGNYEFVLLLTKGSQQYAGSAVQAVSDGTFDVPMTVRPVIGDTVTDVTRLADIYWNIRRYKQQNKNTHKAGIWLS